MANAPQQPQKKPPPEPVISTAWWNNEAFYSTMHVLRGLGRGIIFGLLIGAVCIAAHATPVILAVSVLASVVGFPVYAGIKAHDAALKADKPKKPRGAPAAYDPARSAAMLQARGANISPPGTVSPAPVSITAAGAPPPLDATGLPAIAAGTPTIPRNAPPMVYVTQPAMVSPPAARVVINVPPRAPSLPLTILPHMSASLPADVKLAPEEDPASARAELAGLSTRYQDAIREEREKAASPEIAQNGRS